MNTYVAVKKSGQDIITEMLLGLKSGEAITTIGVGSGTPASANTPTLSIVSAGANPIVVQVTKGDTGVAYGFPFTITTNMRMFVVTLAVNVVSDTYAPSKAEDPDSYQDLVGKIDAGKTALATTAFQLPPEVNPSNGYVTWDLMDAEGIVYSSGNAFEYRVRSTGPSTIVIARSLINVPADIPPTVDAAYQLRYTLTVDGRVAYNYESIQVYGFPAMQLGATDSIEMLGDIATLSLVTEELYQNYAMEIWQNNTMLATQPIPNPERIANGYFVAGSLDTSQLVVSLIPYKVIWKFWNTPAQTFRESCSLWIVNDSIINSVEDVKSKVNKARMTLYGTPDTQFPSTEIMKWLRRGMDAFNAAYGQFTFFTMTNAMGPVREYWLLYAEVSALNAQYLCEGEKAFQFQGAAITLEVDRTAYLDSMASKLQSIIDAEIPNIKKNLIIKGNIGGDGSGPNGDGNFSTLGRGAMGTVGLTITVASLYGGFISRIR